jgi:hypothetical protein
VTDERSVIYLAYKRRGDAVDQQQGTAYVSDVMSSESLLWPIVLAIIVFVAFQRFPDWFVVTKKNVF